ncbi:hypothetical protein Hanom_Chr13g01207961 [Helianthus anomalus]
MMGEGGFLILVNLGLNMGFESCGFVFVGLNLVGLILVNLWNLGLKHRKEKKDGGRSAAAPP